MAKYLDYDGLVELVSKLKNWTGTNYESIEDAEEAHNLLQAAVTSLQSSKQDVLTAGTGINISNNTISCTLDTTVFKIVDALPTTDINTNVIYVVPSDKTGEQNLYAEYIYVNGSWEKLGEFLAETDLSDYYTKSLVDALIAAAQLAIDNEEAEIQEILNTMLTKSEAESTYAKSSDVYTKSETYTKTEVDNLIDNVTVDLSDYYTKEECDDTFATKTEVSDLEQQVEENEENIAINTEDIEEIKTQLLALTGDTVSWITNDDYLLAAVDCEDTLLWGITKEGKIYIPAGLTEGLIDSEQSLGDLLGNYVTTEYLQKNYYDNATVDQKIADAVMGGQVDLSGYLKKSEAEELYQPIGDYALKSEIPTALSSLTNDVGYITKSTADEQYVQIVDYITTSEIDALF